MKKMKTTVLSKLSKTIPTRILWEKSSFKRKYSEKMSRRRIDINTISLFINKKEGCKSSSRSLNKLDKEHNTGW
jgi:hypothetical protein